MELVPYEMAWEVQFGPSPIQPCEKAGFVALKNSIQGIILGAETLGPQPDTEPGGILNLDFSDYRAVRNKFLYLQISYSVVFYYSHTKGLKHLHRSFVSDAYLKVTVTLK
jgi:hypothetical protein